MGDLKSQNTSYPTALDTATAFADGSDEIVAQGTNGPNTAIIAIETALGITPQGSTANVAARLGVMLHADGGMLRGTSFPLSPPNIPHMFYRTDVDTVYYYSTTLGSYISLATAIGLTNYVRTDVNTTISATHTFNPAAPGVPFILGANAQGQKVIGLDADTVDGKNPGSANGLATLDGSTLVPVAQIPTLDHTTKLSNVGTNTHAAIDTFIASKAAASGLASLDSSSKVAQIANSSDLLTLSTELMVSNLSNNLTLDLGTVTTGERWLVFVSAYVVASGTMSMVFSSIWKYAGTGSGVFDAGIGTPIMAMSQTASNKYEGTSAMIFRVTNGGTCGLALNTSQTGGTGASYGATMYAVRIH